MDSVLVGGWTVGARPTRSDPWAAPEGAREDNKSLEKMPGLVPDRRSVSTSVLSAPPPSLSPSDRLCPSPGFLPLSESLWQALSLSLSVLSLSESLSLSLSPSPSLSESLKGSLSLPLPPSLPLSPSLSLSHSDRLSPSPGFLPGPLAESL